MLCSVHGQNPSTDTTEREREGERGSERERERERQPRDLSMPVAATGCPWVGRARNEVSGTSS